MGFGYGLSRDAVSAEPPRDPAHGDLATNAAMVLAKPAGANPRELAGRIVEKLGHRNRTPESRSKR